MFDQILNNLILRHYLNIGFNLNQYIDKGILQTWVFGPRGINDTLNIIVYNFIKLSTGSLSNFSIYLISSLLIFIIGFDFGLIN